MLNRRSRKSVKVPSANRFSRSTPARLAPAVLALVFFLLAVTGVGADATAVVWSGGAGGGTAWLTTTNWTGSVVPTGTQIAQFDAAGTAAGIGINMNGAQSWLWSPLRYPQQVAAV